MGVIPGDLTHSGPCDNTAVTKCPSGGDGGDGASRIYPHDEIYFWNNVPCASANKLSCFNGQWSCWPMFSVEHLEAQETGIVHKTWAT